MTRLLRQAWALGRRDLALQRSYGWTAWIGVFAGVLGLVSYHFIGRLVGADEAARLTGGSYIAFVWTGVMVQMVVASTLGALGGALAREAVEGTLEPEVAAGASPSALLLGAAIAPGVLALGQVAIHAIFGVPLFSLPVSDARAVPALAALLATVLACAPIGVAGAAAWLLLRRPGLVTTAVLFVFGIAGGVYFPVELLPDGVARLASWVPLAIGLDAVRASLLEGAGWTAIAAPLARLAVLTAAGLPLSLWLLHLAWERSRMRGTLAHV